MSDSPPAPVDLLFGVHAHQPIGNFPEVISEAHLRCYAPFIHTLAEYPDFHFSVHFSGWLLDELWSRWPEDMQLLAEMTARGQVEWFSSGNYEPVLAAIPERDRLGQLSAMKAKIKRYFKQNPQGAWLTERVWESPVTRTLANSSLQYVAVDDYHLLCAGVDSNQLDGYFSTEEDGRYIDIFPISEAARYRLPFAPAHETIAWLEESARQGQQASVYFDDIEKFGIWPETFQWVYEEGWLRQFIEGVLASPLVRTSHYHVFHAQHATRGIVYMPNVSYSEMNEWSLPAPSAQTYHQMVKESEKNERIWRERPFIRGGIWRNFMMRYPEANWMHKRMLQVSKRFDDLPKRSIEKKERASMQDCLHRSQANDAYWHGLFGGIYLPHLRRAVWNSILQLESMLDRHIQAESVSIADIDHNGQTEISLRDCDSQGSSSGTTIISPTLLGIVRSDGDAALVEFSSLQLTHNFCDTLRRHVEYYHQKAAEGNSSMSVQHDGGIASAHERVAFVHEIRPEDLLADQRPRSSFLDSLISRDEEQYVLANYHHEAGTDATFVHTVAGGHLRKVFKMQKGCLSVNYELNTIHTGESPDLQVQINLAMPSCDGFGGRYRLADGNIAGGFGDELSPGQLKSLSLEDAVLGGEVRLGSSQLVEVRARPHCTVSNSEAGFEKIMQAVEINLRWSPDVSAGNGATLAISLSASKLPTV